MKFLILALLSLLLLSGCGGEPQENDVGNNVNRFLEINPDDNFNTDEKNRILQMCNALKDKVTRYMGNHVGTNASSIKLRVRSAGCGENLGVAEDIDATVSLLDQRLFFQGDRVHFNEVVASGSKVMETYCQGFSAQEETKRYVEAGSDVVWNYALAGTDPDCVGQGGQDYLCLVKFTGKLVEGSTERYQVVASDKIVISTKFGNTNGVVTNREQTSSCSSSNVTKRVQQNLTYN